MRLSVHYVTSYHYSAPATRVIQLLRLTPHSFPGQNVLDWRIDLDCDAHLRERRDGYGNITHMLYLDRPVDALKVTVAGRLLTEDKAGIVAGVPGDLPPEIFLRPTPLTALSRPLAELASALDQQGGTVLDRLHRLTGAIHTRMSFDPGRTATTTTAADAFAAGHGVCQDFAHILIAVARAGGIPARYVSGHLYRRDGALRQEAGHAWAEAWVEGLGWVAFDPSNGICADDAYIRVACGLDYRDAAPVSGARAGGGGEALAVAVEVRQTGRMQRQGQGQSQGGAGGQAQAQSQN